MHNCKYIFPALLVLLNFTGTSCTNEPPVKPIIPGETDTTSHDFIFFVDTLGDGNASVIKDVAIITDSQIYVGGEIYIKDSTGNFEYPRYNAATWNGKKWILQKIPYYSGNTPFYSPIEWIYILSDEDIWFGNSVHWNGKQFHNIDIGGSIFFGIGTRGMWGSPSNIYVIGNLGRIAFYNGTNWQKIETGTDLDIQDLWGDKNPITGENEIYAVASTPFTGSSRKIFRLQGTTATEIQTNGIQYSTTSIWFKSQKQYYVAGGGMWKKNNITTNEPWNSFGSGVTPFFLYSMRGQSENDIVAVGSFGELIHYNGKSWKSFKDLPGFYNLELLSVAIKGDMICAVGNIGNRACVVRGYRNK